MAEPKGFFATIFSIERHGGKWHRWHTLSYIHPVERGDGGAPDQGLPPAPGQGLPVGESPERPIFLPLEPDQGGPAGGAPDNTLPPVDAPVGIWPPLHHGPSVKSALLVDVPGVGLRYVVVPAAAPSRR